MILQHNAVFPVSGKLTDVDRKAVLRFSGPAGLIRRGHSETCESKGSSRGQQ